ncbi:50S ribosomal protein L17 [Patescibacteria group bacterium]|nr:50S ribosomal protein L17 [Patescibacteria group bacterium]
MRHRKKKDKLNIAVDHRKALIRNLVTSIIIYEKVQTTDRKAKLAVPVVEKLIALSKRKDKMNAIRDINKVVFDKNACKKLMEDLSKRYENQDSGFTRTVGVGYREGDNAHISLVELI